MCAFGYARISYDLDLNPMTVIYEIDLDIVKLYLHYNMKFLGQGFRKLEQEQHRQTQSHRQRQMRPKLLPQ